MVQTLVGGPGSYFPGSMTGADRRDFSRLGLDLRSDGDRSERKETNPIVEANLHGFYLTTGNGRQYIRFRELMKADPALLALLERQGVQVTPVRGYHDMLHLSVEQDRGICIRKRRRGRPVWCEALTLKRKRCLRLRSSGARTGSEKSSTWQIVAP